MEKYKTTIEDIVNLVKEYSNDCELSKKITNIINDQILCWYRI